MQLILTENQLTEIGFKKVGNDYQIPTVNGVFIYKINEKIYKWYHTTKIEENYYNHIHLSIGKIPELILVLQVFKVKINKII